MKRKLLLAALCVVGALGMRAQKKIYIETDLTAQFEALTVNTNWATYNGGSAGYTATEYCPMVEVNGLGEKQVCEVYNGSCDKTGDVLYQTVTDLTPGTYRIELYGAAAFTFGRGFSSTAFSTGTYSAGDKIVPSEDDNVSTGVTLYAESEGKTYGGEIPIYYATSFPEGAATVTLDDVVVGESGAIKIGMNKTSTSTNWHVIQLKSVIATVDAEAQLKNCLQKAQTVLDDKAYAIVTGEERKSLVNAISDYASPEQNAAAYKAAIDAISEATTTFTNSVAYYETMAVLNAEVAVAKSLGVDVSAYETGVTPEEVPAAVEALKAAEYVQVRADYTLDAATLIPEFAEWEGNMVSNKGQHWDGTETSTYYEQTQAEWKAENWTNKKKTIVNLPKGKYVLYAAGRASGGATADIKVNDEERIYSSKGDTGFGVATDGTATFDPTASYANGNKGRGWEYRYIAFEVTADEGEDITLEIGGSATTKNQWMSFTAPVLLTTADNGAITKKVLAANIATAQAIVEAKAGVGEALFMIPTEAFETFEAAVNEAQTVNDKAGATTDEVQAANEALTAAIEAYNNTPVNAPDPNKQYAFQLSGTSLYMNLADDGIKIKEEATPLSFIAAEAGKYYLTTEEALSVGLEGTNNWTMSTAADKRTACSFTALGNGGYHINNVKGLVGTDNTTSGSSCYANKTTSNNVAWMIKEVSTANMSVKAGKWGTFVAPFDVTLPEGVKAYTVTGVENDQIVKEEVEETIPANTPVVLLNEAEEDIEETITGVGLPESETVTEGLLTGIYQAGADIPAESYVLQTQDGKQAFYHVAETFAGQGVANRCYLTMSAGSAPLRAIFLGNEEGTTGIEAAEATSAENGILYNLAGQKVDASYKGIVIKKGKTMLKK